MKEMNRKLWEKSAAWWDERQLMQMREVWIEKQVEIVVAIADTFTNGYVSKSEWKATVAEASFDTRYYRQPHLPRGSLANLALNQMRNTWAEEAMMFFTIGQPIEETFDLTAHGQAMRRHHEERVDWRPHHRLPGPPDSLYTPVPPEGLTHEWWHNRTLQELRHKVVLGNLMQNDMVAQVVSDDPMYTVRDSRDFLACRQGFGFPFRRCDDKLCLSDEQDHFERGVFAMMRGFVGEVQAFTKYGFPITTIFDPTNLWTICQAKGLPWHSPYLTKGAPCW